MTESEDIIRKKYEDDGFTVTHCGAPDFLIFKYIKESNEISEIQFVEVKNKFKSPLTSEQLIWKQALESLGCKYKIERTEEKRPGKHCPSCGHQLLSLYYRTKEKNVRSWEKTEYLYCTNCENEQKDC